MAERRVDVAIIGAGTAGMSALTEVERQRASFVLVDRGPIGTTCARVGCMPSKALIQLANQYRMSQQLERLGLASGPAASIDLPAVFRHVRTLRDTFVHGIVSRIEKLGANFIHGSARFIGPKTILVGSGDVIHAEHFVIATGSSPHIPKAWQDFGDLALTTDSLFEQEQLPRRLGVIGLGPLGAELGQALARFGLEVFAFDQEPFLAGLSDPDVNTSLCDALKVELSINLNANVTIKREGSGLQIDNGSDHTHVDRILVATGRRPNLAALELEKAGCILDAKEKPTFAPETLKEAKCAFYFPGDVNGLHPILHEAAFDGRLAGQSANGQVRSTARPVKMLLAFTEPNAAVLGVRFRELDLDNVKIGTVFFRDQGRAILMNEAKGCLRVYVDIATEKVIGAELAAPAGEHLAHLLAWAIQSGQTVPSLLKLPFYHPTVEEGLRTALKSCVRVK